jgi:RNase P/RNase MRP subunit POP5
MKLKSKPSQRIKKRYLLIEGKKEGIEKAILDYIGILGYAKVSPIFVDNKTNTILAIERSELTKVRAAIEASKSNLRVLRVSGTIKGIER